NVRGNAGRRRVEAGALHEVGAIEARAAYAHEHFTIAGGRFRTLLDFELAVDDRQCAHGAHATSRAETIRSGVWRRPCSSSTMTATKSSSTTPKQQSCSR